MQEITKLSRHVKLFDTGQRIRDKQGKERIVYRQVIQRGQHYKDPRTGSYMDFVSDWEFESGFGHKIKKADHNLRIWNRTLRFGFTKGVYVDYTLPVKAPGFNGNECLIPDAWPNTDLKYTVFPEGVKGDIVLKAPGHPSSFSFPVSTTSCTAQQEGNMLVFYRQGGPVGRITTPYMEDANGKRGLVILTYDGQNIIFTPDLTWLQTATYPVVIDPTTVLQPDVADGVDAYIYANDPNRNYNNIRVFVGGNCRGLFKIPYHLLPINFQALSTIIELYLYLDPTGLPNDVEVHEITGNWEESTVTWNTQPAFDSAVLATVAGLTSEGSWYSWNIGNVVPVNGVLFKATNEPANQKIFYSSDYTNASLRPKFIIDYIEPSTTKASVFGPINALGRRLIA